MVTRAGPYLIILLFIFVFCFFCCQGDVTIFHTFYMKCVAFVLHEVCSPDQSVFSWLFSFIKAVFTYRVSSVSSPPSSSYFPITLQHLYCLIKMPLKGVWIACY